MGSEGTSVTVVVVTRTIFVFIINNNIIIIIGCGVVIVIGTTVGINKILFFFLDLFFFSQNFDLSSESRIMAFINLRELGYSPLPILTAWLKWSRTLSPTRSLRDSYEWAFYAISFPTGLWVLVWKKFNRWYLCWIIPPL